jgi:hypothetical protein
MPHALIVSGGNYTVQASSARYFHPCTGALSGQSTESWAQRTFRSAGTLSNLLVNVTTNDIDQSELILIKNGSQGNLAISITSSTTGKFEDTTHSDSIAAGDVVVYRIVSGDPFNGAAGLAITVLSAIFETSTCTSTFAISPNGTITNAPGSKYSNIAANPTGTTTTEAFGNARVYMSGTLKNFYANVTNNVLDPGSMNIVARVSYVDTNLGYLVVSAATGIFEDIDSAAVASGDVIGYRFHNV